MHSLNSPITAMLQMLRMLQMQSLTPACCLQVAGSADAFRKVDYDYVAKSAELAKKANVPHFSLVTAQGANGNVWASDIKLFHGLLYTQTKGRVSRGPWLCLESCCWT